jgi:hypothetical protein
VNSIDGYEELAAGMDLKGGGGGGPKGEGGQTAAGGGGSFSAIRGIPLKTGGVGIEEGGMAENDGGIEEVEVRPKVCNLI